MKKNSIVEKRGSILRISSLVGLVVFLMTPIDAQDPLGLYEGDSLIESSTDSLPQLFVELPSFESVGEDGETFSKAYAEEFGAGAGKSSSADADSGISILPAGFLRSRWAMSDPVYAKNYANGASKKNLPKKIKQASDARFVRGFGGQYYSAGLTAIGETSSPLGSLELGHAHYVTSYLTNRLGFVAAANSDDYFVGGEAGFRLQTPTRLAPFAGAGLFAGFSEKETLAEDDHVDNDEDGTIDEHGETESNFDGALIAIYPEMGVHYWWTPRFRFSGFGRYLVTSEGRSADAWYIGVAIAVLSR